MRNSIIKGTVILTVTSLITRLLGFLYRMILSATIGADNVGLYQLCMSILGIAMAISAGALTTAVSKYVAASEKAEQNSYLTGGIIISAGLSVIIYFLMTTYATPLAQIMLIGEENAELISIMAIALPFASIHGIISGYYYGKQKTAVPAVSTLCEQIVRVGTMYMFPLLVPSDEIGIELAFYSMIAGEVTSFTYCIISLAINRSFKPSFYSIIGKSRELIAFSLPLTASRLLTHVLSSIEAVLIPVKLQLYGMTRSSALSEYGILTGMALPFILLPTIVTNAISILLLPLVSQNASTGQNAHLKQVIDNCLRFCSCMGIFCVGVFLVHGKYLGAILFANEALIYFIETLAFLCPLLFLGSTIGSILNGLGHSSETALYNTIGILIRLAFVIIGIPMLGINAYMYGLLISQALTCLMHHIRLRQIFPTLHISSYSYILKPAVQTIISLALSYLLVIPFAGIVRYCLGCLLSVLIFYLFISKELRTLLRH